MTAWQSGIQMRRGWKWRRKPVFGRWRESCCGLLSSPSQDERGLRRVYIGSGNEAGSGGRVRSNVTTMYAHAECLEPESDGLDAGCCGPCGVISSVANSNTGLRLATHETGARCRILICFFRLTVSYRHLASPPLGLAHT